MSDDLTLAGSAEPGDVQAQPDPDSVTANETTEAETTPEPETPSAFQAAMDEMDSGEDETSSGSDPRSDEGTRRKRRPVQPRIDELTSRWRTAERMGQDALTRAERAEERLNFYEGPPPSEDQFETHDQYQSAFAAHQFGRFQTQEKERDAADARQEAEAAGYEVLAAATEIYTTRAEAFAETVPDYHDLVEGPDTQFSAVMATELLVSEKGPEAAYYLAKHPQELARIARLTNPMDVAREIARIEGRLTVPAPRRITAAPNPMRAVAKGSGSQSDFDPAKASIAELQQLFIRKGV